MKSTMTKKAFEAAVMEEMAGVDGKLRWSVTEVAKAVAIRAGLEFAPEPVSLPKTVTVMQFHGGAVELCPGDRTWMAGREEKLALYREAKARYDAYPGLREAAERLTALISPQVQIKGVTGADVDSMREALADLRDALAKGPK